MSGETEEQVSGWTTDTLHAHLQSQMKDHRLLLDERYLSQTVALNLALSEIKDRLAAMNEFRGELSDRTATFISREVAEARFNELEKQINVLSSRQDSMNALSTQGQRNIGILLTVIGLIITVVVLLANNVFS